MSDFLELLETVRSEDASIQRLFGRESGRGLSGLRRDDPRYERAFSEAAGLVAAVVRGSQPMYRLQEAMSTSDFPLLFGDVIDRTMLGVYQEWPTQWNQIARRATVRDFRTVKRNTLDGAEATLDAVPAGDLYPAAGLTEAGYSYAVKKYGRRVPLMWEVFVNDDLEAFRDIPNRLAKASRMSEERFATELYASASGPDSTFFTVGNGNRLTGAGSALSVAALQAAFEALWAQVDTDGNPIFTGQVRLVVPPALAVTARNILNATEIRVAAGSGASSDQLVAANWVKAEVAAPIVNPWLPIIDTTSGSTAWYLFAEPNVGRPALEVGFLRGHETPELFMKDPDAKRIGGGIVGAEEGSFDNDGIDYKVRHVFGGTKLEPKAAVANVGA